jgi:hypothetical protein
VFAPSGEANTIVFLLDRKRKKKGIINRKINEFPSELIVPSQKWYFWRLFGINKKVEERKRESSD